MSSPGSRLSWRPWVSVLLLNMGVYVLAHGSAFGRPMMCNDDVRQQIFWMQQWQDSELYPDDLQTDYARSYVPWGVKCLYRPAALFVSPLTAAKFVTGLLFTVLGVLLWLIGRELGGSATGWCVTVVYWVSPFFLDRMSGGLARAFAGPLLACFMLGGLRRNVRLMGAALCLQALMIPYMVPVCAGALCLMGLRWPRTSGPYVSLRRVGVPAIVLAFVLVGAWSSQFGRAGYGPWAGRAELVGEVFSRAGRYGYGVWPPDSLFEELLIRPWERLRPERVPGLTGTLAAVAVLAPLTIAGLVRVDWRGSRPGLLVWVSIGLSAIAVYTIARLFPLRFFLPDRYLIYPVHFAYVFLAGSGLGLLWSRVRAGLKAGVAGVAAAAILGGVVCLHGAGLDDFSGDEPVVRAVQALPRHTRFAGPPALMDQVLTFGKRPVHVSFELAHPWLVGYWRRIEPRLTDLFNAYYTDDPAVVRAFARRYHIDWMVVDDRDFVETAPGPAAYERDAPDYLLGRPFFAPFDAQIERLKEPGKRYALLLREGFDVVPVDAHRVLVRVRDEG